jgi:hypothetical protein
VAGDVVVIWQLMWITCACQDNSLCEFHLYSYRGYPNGLSSFPTHSFSFLLSSPHTYAMANWGPDMQTWCDLLNTTPIPTTQALDEFVDSSLLRGRFDASLTPHPHALFQPESTSRPPSEFWMSDDKQLEI